MFVPFETGHKKSNNRIEGEDRMVKAVDSVGQDAGQLMVRVTAFSFSHVRHFIFKVPDLEVFCLSVWS